ncbi:uncharacterized protein KY384_008903 [Bacidia gigantensis]|uniref:uncharacterized protein n=1 Tax=Bacidia gigantensis TaxID=2732470 RepID=UPI001D045815|nr:uncharacterized protein KY384_008903 [Bacidia gigantensis]KAG8525259.1 hypothetical protein KY384_008903 [Bacidia gigantensis]
MAFVEQRDSRAPRLGANTQSNGQSLTLQFVNVALTSSPALTATRTPEEGRRIRAHVMKDYLQQRAKSSNTRKSPPASSSLSDHLGRFRLPSLHVPKQSRHRKTVHSSRGHVIAPAPAKAERQPTNSNKDEVSCKAGLATPLGNNAILGMSTPIDVSRAGTSTLLEYYHTSYWDNSLAVNPEGQFMSIAITDPALLHATLYLVALHKLQTRRETQASPYLWHRGEAMRLVSNKLCDPETAISDATLGAVALLSAVDNSMTWPGATQTSHLEGMITLVRLRGGIDCINAGRQIKRVVAWADTLHATAHNSLPQLNLPLCTAHDQRKRFMDFVDQHRRPTRVTNNALPTPYRNILDDLRALAIAKSLLRKQPPGSKTQELRLIFSDLVFATEHKILQLGHPSSPPKPHTLTEDDRNLEAFKAATLLFTFSHLRDIAVTATFFATLARRLRNALADAFSYLPTSDLGNPASPLASFLLWLCMNGWRASTVEGRESDREVFVEKAAIVCERAGIYTEENLNKGVDEVEFLPEVDRQDWSGLWADIES